MSTGRGAPRPHKRAEFVVEFATRSAQKGWRDCLAVARIATVDAWERLTTAPMLEDERLYRLKADFATGSYEGQTLKRWQYTITSGGRIWYFVILTPGSKTAGRDLLERCEPGHPKEAERRSPRLCRRTPAYGGSAHRHDVGVSRATVYRAIGIPRHRRERSQNLTS